MTSAHLHPADALPMWVIYERPSDYPHSYVARLWYVKATAQPTNIVAIAPTLERVRAMITPGLTCLARDPSDDPKIVETWL